MVAQIDNNQNARVLKKPAAGEMREVVVGSELDVSFSFDLDSVLAVKDGDNLILTFEDQSVLKLLGFVNGLEPVDVILQDGTVLSAEAIMEAIGDDGFIDTAASAASSSPQGSGSSTLSGFGEMLVGLEGQESSHSYDEFEQSFASSSSSSFSASVDGTENTPVAAVDDTSSVMAGELTHILDGAANPSVSGNVFDNDIDSDGDTLSVTGSTSSAQYGTFSFNPDGTWTYTLDNQNGDIVALGDGDSRTDSITYTVSDGQSSDTATLTVTINGTNDRPEVVVATVDAPSSEVGDYLESPSITAGVVEHGFADVSTDLDSSESGTSDGLAANGVVNEYSEVGSETTASGTLKFADVDTADHGNGESNDTGSELTYSVSSKDSGVDDSGSSNVLTSTDGNTGLSVEGKYGTLHYDTENGKWDYQLDNNDSDTQDLYSLKKGSESQDLETGEFGYTDKTGQDRFTVTASDGHGGTVEKEIVINVEGSFDPVEYTLTYGSDSGESNRASWHNAVGYTVTYEDGTTSSYIAWSEAHRGVNNEGGVAKFIITEPFVDVDFFVIPQGAKFLNTDSEIRVGSDNVLEYLDPATGLWTASTVKAGSTTAGQIAERVQGDHYSGDLPGEGTYDFEDYVEGTPNYHDVNFSVEAQVLTESQYASDGTVSFNITGTETRDELHGTDYDDTITGGDGNDVIAGNGGTNILKGGDGSDTFMGGEGVDSFYGGDEDTDLSQSDLVSYENSQSVTVDLSGNTQNSGDAEHDTFNGIENLRGSAFDDNLTGDGEVNRIEGGAGDDTIRGGDGSDVLYGGEGQDTIYGGTALGASDGSTAGNYIEGGAGGAGDYFKPPSATISVNGDELHGSKGADVIFGDNGITKGAPNSLVGKTAQEILEDGHYKLEGSTSGEADYIDAGAGNDIVFAGVGNDFVFGWQGNDTIYGEGGADILKGESGNDIIHGGAGGDTIVGGTGFDTVSYAGDNGGEGISFVKSGGSLTISGGDANGDSVQGVEALIGSDHRDIIKLDNDWKDIDAGKGMDLVEINDSDGIDGVHVDLGEGGISSGPNSGAEIVKFVSNQAIKATADGGTGLDSLEVDKEGSLSAVITSAPDGGGGFNAVVSADADATNIQGENFEQLKFNSASKLDVSIEENIDHLDLYTADNDIAQTNTTITANSDVGKLSVTAQDRADTVIIQEAGGNIGELDIHTWKGDDVVTVSGQNVTGTIDAGDGRDVVQIAGEHIDVTVDLGEGGEGGGAAEIVKFTSENAIKATVYGGSGVDDLEVDKSGALAAVIAADGAGFTAEVTDTSGTQINADGFEQLKFNSATELDVTIKDNVEHLDLYTADNRAGDTTTTITTEASVGKISVTSGDNADTIEIKDTAGKSFDKELDLHTWRGDDVVTVSGQSVSGSINTATEDAETQAGDTDVDSDSVTVNATTLHDLTVITGAAGHKDGDDTVTLTADSAENVTVNTGAGSDLIDLSGIDSGDVTVNAGDGNDTMLAGAATETFAGGDGIDTVSYAASDSAVRVDLTNTDSQVDFGTPKNGDAVGDTLSSIEAVIGSDYNDTLVGNNDGNRLEGGDGLDTIIGGSGNDIIFGGTTKGSASELNSALEDLQHADSVDEVTTIGDRLFGYGQDNATGRVETDGKDIINSGAGNDIVFGGRGDDEITTGDGIDYIRAGFGDDVINSGAGDDIVYGRQGNDTIKAGSGNDKVTDLIGNNHVEGGHGSDAITTGSGNDVVLGGTSVNLSAENVAIAHAEMSSATDAHAVKAAGDKLINTFTKNNHADGKDVIHSGDGNDIVFGGYGDDEIHAGKGNDYIRGGLDNDHIYGDDGHDVINGGSGSDTLEGGSGDDLFIGGAGADTFYGGTKADGDSGYDTVSYEGNDAVTVNLSNSNKSTGAAKGDTFNGIEEIIGSSKNDTLEIGESGPFTVTISEPVNGVEHFVVTDVNDNIVVTASDFENIKFTEATFVKVVGNESASGVNVFTAEDKRVEVEVEAHAHSELSVTTGNLSDTIDLSGAQAKTAKVTVDAGDGDDTIYAGAAQDIISGGDGIDTVSYEKSATGVTVDLTGVNDKSTGDAQGDSFDSIEKIVGSGQDDTFFADVAESHTIDGGAGFDTVDYSQSSSGAKLASSGSGWSVSKNENGASTTGHLERIENFVGTDQADSVTMSGANASNLTFSTGGGDDKINFNGTNVGNLIFNAGSGNDVIDYFGTNAGDVAINAGDGDNKIDFNGANSRNFTVIAGSGDDEIDYFGTNADDVVINAGDGDNEIDFNGANSRNFTVNAGSGVDVIDFVGPNSGDVVINAGDGDNEISFDGDNDKNLTINSGSGIDTIVLDGMSSGIATVSTGGGDDHIDLTGMTSGNVTVNAGDGSDTMLAGAATETFNGGEGIDTVSYAASDSAVRVDLTNTGVQKDFDTPTNGDAVGDTLKGIENLTGSEHADTLTGNEFDNVIKGGDVSGDRSPVFTEDFSDGGSRWTSVSGGKEVREHSVYNEGTLSGQGKVLEIDAENGVDKISTTVDTKVGQEYVFSFKALIRDNPNAAQNEALIITIGGKEFTVTPTRDDQSNNTDNLFETYSIRFTGTGEQTEISFAELESQNSTHGVLVDDIKLEAIDDVIHGGGGDDTILGEGGHDVLFGDEGADTIEGGAGDDFLVGGTGADTLYGGTSADGDSGIDTASYESSEHAVNVDLAQSNPQVDFDVATNGDAVGDVLDGIENLIGSANADTLTGDAAANTIDGGAGSDTIHGGAGNDVLYGGDGGEGSDLVVNGDFSNFTGDAFLQHGDHPFFNGDSSWNGGDWIEIGEEDNGNLFAEVDNSGTVRNVTQSIDTEPDHEYILTFDVANVGKHEQLFVDVTGDHNADLTVVGKIADGSWQHQALTFEAHGENSLLDFYQNSSHQGGSSSNGVHIDNVSVVKVDDHLYGDEGNDILNGGAGNDILNGGDDADIFLFTADDFQTSGEITVIEDYGNGHDSLAFSDVLDSTSLTEHATVSAVDSGDSGILTITDSTTDFTHTIVFEGYDNELDALALQVQQMITNN